MTQPSAKPTSGVVTLANMTGQVSLMVMDIKFGDLRRKCRLVAGATDVDPPEHVVTHASVVSRDSVRIAFTLAALNDMDVMGADCQNAYLNAPSRERLCTKLGPEFGEYQGRWARIKRALYGSKSAAASWRSCIHKGLQSMGFKNCSPGR